MYLHPLPADAPEAPVTQLPGELSVTGIVHQGIDWAAPIRTPVRACTAGQVIARRNGVSDNLTGDWQTGDPSNSGYGNFVLLEHDDGGQSRYAHFTPGSVTVELSDRVERGQVIGAVGSSGLSSGPHLHFELRLPPDLTRLFDPRPLLTFEEEENMTDRERADLLDGLLKANLILMQRIRALLNGELAKYGG